jgi:hypothetical protein
MKINARIVEMTAKTRARIVKVLMSIKIPLFFYSS